MRTPIALALTLLIATPALADNLYAGANWTALASDRRASAVGDVITVLILTNNNATNSVGAGSRRDNAANGSIAFGSSFDESAGISFGGTSKGEGTTTRSDRIAAQLSARVDAVMPNGDLAISGWQALRINGEKTNVRISGVIRPEDIDGANTIVSSRIANAQIDYDGEGFSSQSAKPGLVTRIFRFLGLM